MADDFKTYDKNPIVGVVQISKWSFGLREVILAIIAGLLLVMVLIFAGLFGKAEQELSESSISASAIVGNSFCVNKGCLETAARSVDFMNKSVDPCQNFYQYACGNYKTARPLGPNRGSRTPFSDLYEVNQDKLEEIMAQPVDRLADWSAERKVKDFFESCNDMFQRERLRGKPFLDKVVTTLGGWDLLGTWNNATWDFNTAMKKVQSEFWVDAFYSPRVAIDFNNNKRRVVQLSPAGVGKWMFSSWYLSPNTEQYRQDYKKFIRRVGSLLLRDSGVVLNETVKEMRLEQFVNDTFLMERHIAEVSQYSRYTENPFLEESKVSLSALVSETNNVIDWTAQIAHLFDGAPITGSTKVVILKREYFRNITAVIASLPDQDRKRILHNYLIWRVAEIYVQDLSWEYVHANREVYIDTRGYANFMGTYNYCFTVIKGYMPDALSALFVSDHFSDKNRQAVHDLTDNLKTALKDRLDKTPWFDEPTKQYAREKLDLVTFKMGYPEWIMNHDSIDQEYLNFNINISDFFDNLIQGNRYVRDLWSRELRDGENREQWLYNTYDTSVAVIWSWNEVIAPAGLLQTPMYDASMPHYSTFGSLGALLGRFIHHVVDDWGKHYDKFGNYMEDASFWSNTSIQNYNKAKMCVDNVYINASRSYTYPNGDSYPITINPRSNTPRAIAITSGVRLAIEGYQIWTREKGLAEKMLPGVSLTNQQMTMLSWAQSECSNRDSYTAFYNAIRGNVEEEILVNTVLGELKEFSDAFQCKSGDPMYHEERCDYY